MKILDPLMVAISGAWLTGLALLVAKLFGVALVASVSWVWLLVLLAPGALLVLACVAAYAMFARLKG